MKNNANNNVITMIKNNEAETEKTENSLRTDENTLIKITPRLDRLTPKGVEMFKNMGDIENAKLWIDDFVMEIGNDHVEMAGMMLLLQAIRDKIEVDNKLDHPVDFISQLQDHLFKWTVEFERASEAYVEALKNGDFILDELVVPESLSVEVAA